MENLSDNSEKDIHKYLNEFSNTLNVMEKKFANMEYELGELTESKRYLQQLTPIIEPCQPPPVVSVTPTKSEEPNVADKEVEKLRKQIEMIEDVNQNLNEDLMEWKNAFLEKTTECEFNRDKFLKTQQIADEYHRQLNAVRSLENGQQNQQNQEHIHLQVTNERFKEQLKELGHLPFILEKKQLELKEIQSKYKLAERTITALSNDLETCIVKCELLQKDFDNEKIKQAQLTEEKNNYIKEIAEWKVKYDTLEKDNIILVKNVEKMQFLEECLQSKTKESHEYCQQVIKVRHEDAKHISRIKERSELQKRAFLSQIAGLEQEMILLRTNLSTSYKDRDEMKQRMQYEISMLEQKFTDSQLEIKNLKSHVDILKSSYSNMLEQFDNDDDYCHNDDGDDYDDDEDDNSTDRYALYDTKKYDKEEIN